MAILGELGATGNWRRIAEELWPWVDAPPSSEMGEAEAPAGAGRPALLRASAAVPAPAAPSTPPGAGVR